MRSQTIFRVIILGALSITALMAIQSYWAYNSYKSQEKEFDDKMTSALRAAATSISTTHEFTLPDNFIRKRGTAEYVVNVDNVFDSLVLERALFQEFQKEGLTENFSYGIYDCYTDSMIIRKFLDLDLDSEPKADAIVPKMAKDTALFNYFSVVATEKERDIIMEMRLTWLSSLLMLLVLSFFIYSMFVILRQKQLSEQQRDFINNMTHEFKTPISTINVSTDVFLNNDAIKSDSRLSRYAGIIKEQTMRLNRQVENVLQIARVERGDLKLKFEKLDLPELLYSLSPSLEIKAGEKDGRLQMNLETADAAIKADRLHLTNIIHNLVDNGVKYSENKPEITITLSEVDEKKVLLSIADKGIGISKEYQKRVFEKFYRVPTGNVHNVKGFGLGLFYVQQMCREHGWKLSLDSELGQGTTVKILMKRS